MFFLDFSMVISSAQSPKFPARRAKAFDQVGVLGFFIISAAIFLLLLFLCFFYVSSSRAAAVPAVVVFGGGGGGAQNSWGLGMKGIGGVQKRGEEEDDGDCDLLQGEWVWDERYPLYDSKDCAFLDEGFRCSENGRPDSFYTKWRWQPTRCNLPR